MKNLSALAALAVFAVACSDPAAPNRTLVPTGVANAISIVTYVGPSGPGGGLAEGDVRLCKDANATGTFGFTYSVNGGATQMTSLSVTTPGTPACTVIHQSIISGNGAPSVVVITEDPDQSAEWALTGIDIIQHLADGLYNQGGIPGGYTTPRLDDVDDVASRTATVYINQDMARTVTFTNTFTDTAEGCTYTKGWYQNKNGAPTVIAVDGRSADEARAIFAATPGKPGGVTWTGKNNTLNLYQQLLAALQNLGGDANAGPDAVYQAIADALAGTGGSGLNITTSLTQSEIGTLTGILASFNEGAYEGWPHCDDALPSN
jgi:hypothetical protein